MSNQTDLLDIKTKVTPQGVLRIDRDTVKDSLRTTDLLNPDNSAILATIVEMIIKHNSKVVYGTSEPPATNTYEEGTIYFQI